MNEPSRFTRLPLPAYRYVPGKGPKDEARKDIPSVETEALPPDRWHENEAYLYGADLFHCGYFYEAHEIWEALWHKVGHQTRQGNFLKALIQTAALQLKLLLGDKKTAKRLGERALALLKKVADEEQEPYMGLPISKFSRSLLRQLQNEGPIPLLSLKEGPVDE